MFIRGFGTVSAVAACAFLFAEVRWVYADQVQQAQFVQDTGAANRIVAGDALATITQEIAAASCFLHADIAADDAAEFLKAAIGNFDLFTRALLDGNESLGIVGGEARPKTVAQLENLIATWAPVRDAASGLLADATDAAAASAVSQTFPALTEAAASFSTVLEAEYAISSQILQSDLLLLKVSGRMARLTQQMAYDVCGIWSGNAAGTQAQTLTEANQVFLTSLDALQNGMPQVGILPAPTPEIAELLRAVGADWAMTAAQLDQIAAGAPFETAARENLYRDLANTLYQVQQVQQNYLTYAERIIN